MNLDRAALQRLGHELLDREERGVRALRHLVDEEPFARAAGLLAACSGRVLVCGVGKSGNVAQRIAASFRSTGAPALFLHPVEAMHGDLGLASSAAIPARARNSCGCFLPSSVSPSRSWPPRRARTPSWRAPRRSPW